jgi:hypothetical protein
MKQSNGSKQSMRVYLRMAQESGVMKVHRGKVHKYLGMSLDFSHKGQCHVTMYDYLDGILQAFDAAVKKHGDGFTPVTRQRFKTTAPDNLFVVNKDCGKFLEAVSADLSTIIAKTLYVTKELDLIHV